MTPTATLQVQEHLFVIGDGHDMPVATADYSTGLAGAMHNAALICTGIEQGPVTVSAEPLPARPGIDNVNDWDDVAEISIYAPTGNLSIDQLTSDPHDLPAALPNMSPQGAGTYRLRIHARGRDQNHNQIVTTSAEVYYLVTWPAPPTHPVIIRATDRCGYGLRLTATTPGPPATQPSEPTPDPARERLLQNLRENL